jgi:hypothetical protein
LAFAVGFVGCRSGTVNPSDIVSELVYAKATKADVIREYGQPIRTSVDGQRETLVYTPYARVISRVSSRVLNGSEAKVETFVSVPGGYEVKLVLEKGIVVDGFSRPISLIDLVDRKATKAELLREFGKPDSIVSRGNREVITFIPPAKITRVVVTRTVNGVESKDETIEPTPGKHKVVIAFLDGVAVEANVK